MTKTLENLKGADLTGAKLEGASPAGVKPDADTKGIL
jgi:uncharacterized protein YjbI with pentapeptide repeats